MCVLLTWSCAVVCSDETDVEVTEVTNETLFLMLSELRPFTDYNVSVFASTAEGAGPEDTLTFTTLQDGEGHTILAAGVECIPQYYGCGGAHTSAANALCT